MQRRASRSKGARSAPEGQARRQAPQDVADDHADDGPKAVRRGDEEIVLADEAQPGLDRPEAFEHRRAVHKRPAGEPRELGLQLFHYGKQPVFDYLVVIYALGETGDSAGCPAVGRQEAEYAPGSGYQQGRIEAFLEVAGQVSHSAVPAFRQIVFVSAAAFSGYSFYLCGAEIQETVCTFIEFY